MQAVLLNGSYEELDVRYTQQPKYIAQQTPQRGPMYSAQFLWPLLGLVFATRARCVHGRIMYALGTKGIVSTGEYGEYDKFKVPQVFSCRYYGMWFCLV